MVVEDRWLALAVSAGARFGGRGTGRSAWRPWAGGKTRAQRSRSSLTSAGLNGKARSVCLWSRSVCLWSRSVCLCSRPDAAAWCFRRARCVRAGPVSEPSVRGGLRVPHVHAPPGIPPHGRAGLGDTRQRQAHPQDARRAGEHRRGPLPPPVLQRPRFLCVFLHALACAASRAPPLACRPRFACCRGRCCGARGERPGGVVP